MPNQTHASARKPTRLPAGLQPAGWGRRIGALFIDWAASSGALLAIGGYDLYSSSTGAFWVLAVFVVELVIFTTLVGGSFGQVVLKLRVRRIDGAALTPWSILIRTLLIALFIPPLVYKEDGRGLHDMAVNSAVFEVTAS